MNRLTYPSLSLMVVFNVSTSYHFPSFIWYFCNALWMVLWVTFIASVCVFSFRAAVWFRLLTSWYQVAANHQVQRRFFQFGRAGLISKPTVRYVPQRQFEIGPLVANTRNSECCEAPLIRPVRVRYIYTVSEKKNTIFYIYFGAIIIRE